MDATTTTQKSEPFLSGSQIIWGVVIAIVIGHVLMILYFAFKKSRQTDEVSKSKTAQLEILLHSMFAIGYLLLATCAITNILNPGKPFLMNLSGSVLITWLVVIISYYTWAIYFYNINLGWSDEKWDRFRMKPADSTKMAPETNPYIDETFGLPPGTVRGTIALSLVVVALALTLHSFALSSTVRTNEILVDNFDFVKKAFLMMIAFYFGAKSLETFQNKPPDPSGVNKDKPEGDGASEDKPKEGGVVKVDG